MTDNKPVSKELLEQLMRDYPTPEALTGERGLLKQLTKAIMERALEAEMTAHLGHERHARVSNVEGNTRNGRTAKTVQGEFGEVEINVPRDRQGSFEPKLIGKHQRRLPGFGERILSLYARGMTVREIQGHLLEMYGTEVSASLISSVTDAVLEEVNAWRNRPLDALYPIVYLDCLFVKMRESGGVATRAVYLAIGVNLDGRKEILGVWLASTEGAKFWLSVITELKNRGVQDILIACVDGLKGFPEAIEAVFPHTEIQLCLVHLVRASLNYVSWKQREAVARDLKTIYAAATVEQAERALSLFAASWDAQYASIAKSWREKWTRIIPFFAYAPEIRRAIYTTNTIESVNYSLRKLIKMRGAFPTEEALMKLTYLALRNASQRWTMPIQNWKAALNQLMIRFEERFATA